MTVMRGFAERTRKHWRARQDSEPFAASGVAASRDASRRTAVRDPRAMRVGWRPAGLEPATPGLEVPRKEPTTGSTTLLPLVLFTFCQTPDHPRPPRAATDCRSFVSRLSPLAVRSRDARTSGLDDNECASESITNFANDVDDCLTEPTAHTCGESNQDDSSRLLSIAVCEQAEVFVFGQEHARFRTGQREDDPVLRARMDFYDGGNVVAGFTESGDDREIATLVSEEPHQLLSAVAGVLADENDLFVGDGVRGVSNRRLDVLASEVRISVKEIALGGALAQFAENQLHWDPRSANNRLSKHHPGVDFDAICESHAKPVSRIHLAANLHLDRTYRRRNRFNGG